MNKLTNEDWLKIAKEYSEKGPTILAHELKVSNQAIHLVVNELRKNGVDIPYRTLRKKEIKDRLDFVKNKIKT